MGQLDETVRQKSIARHTALIGIQDKHRVFIDAYGIFTRTTNTVVGRSTTTDAKVPLATFDLTSYPM